MKKIYLLFIPLLFTLNSFAQFNISFNYENQVQICDGNEITIIVSADITGTFVYEWNTGETTNTISTSQPGEYIVKVTDANQYSVSDTITVTISQTPEINLDHLPTHLCYNSGDTLLMPDSNEGYFYGDNVLNGYFSPNSEIIGDNKIYYEVWYGMECLAIDSAVISVTQLTVKDQTIYPESCNKNNGEIHYIPSGGVSPYSYEWSTGDTTSSIKNLGQGNYDVTISDASDCSEQFNAQLYSDYLQTIADFDILNKDEVKEAPYTLYLKNKSREYCYVNWNVSSGNTYLYSYETNPIFILKDPGTYTVSLDASGGGESYDYTSQTITIVEPTPDTALIGKCDNFNVDLDIIDNICWGDKKGEITATATGGAEPYRYFWSTTRTDNKISNLKAGIYIVTVTDIEGCKKVVTGEVKDSAQIYIYNSNTIAPTSCTATDGSIDVTIQGGVPPYTFAWNNDVSGPTNSNLGIGTYKLLVTDDKGCTYNYSTNLQSTDAPNMYINNLYPTNCYEPSGGIEIYSYGSSDIVITWSDLVSSKNISQRTSLTPGLYTVIAEDTVTKCKTKLDIQVESSVPERQEICIVTVSPETGKNLVVWEPVQFKDEIDYYSIYKENPNTKEYEVIGTVSSEEMSVFRDEDSNPKTQSERYKISATNYCGIESELSYEHKTIHLQSEFGIKEYIELIQDFYEGHYVYTYKLWANTRLGYSYPIGSYNSQSKEAWINKLVPDASIIRYYMTMEVESPCAPFAQNELKEESGPFSLAMSNIAEAETTDITSVDELLLTVSPNPSKGIVTIEIPEDGELNIYSIDGKTLISESVNVGDKTINAIPTGIYMVKLQGNKSYYSTFVVE